MGILEIVRWVDSKDPAFKTYLRELSGPLAQATLIGALLTEGLEASHKTLLLALETIRS